MKEKKNGGKLIVLKGFRFFLEEKQLHYANWVRPSDKDLEHEYKIEYLIKPLKNMTGNAFPTLESFLDAAKKGKVITLTKEEDRKIQYRSHTQNKEELLALIKGYASYPQYRNEKTIESIYDGFKSNQKMSMPVVLQFKNGPKRIMGGNTRLDVAQHLGIQPKVLLIQVP
jgi:hypothetical protein